MLAAAILTGRILFAGLPVPGAIVTASQGEHLVTTASNADGVFRLADLNDGRWTIRVQMRGFVDVTREVVVPSADPPLTITLTMRSYAEIVGTAGPPPPPAPLSTDAPDTNDIVDVVNGSVVNGAATPFAQPRAFGNNRPRPGEGYQGLVNAVFANSAWNARPFSFGNAGLPAPSTGDTQISFTLGGPLKIPHLLRGAQQMLLTVQHGVTHTATSASAIVPTLDERSGDFSASPIAVRDPMTGLPFAGGTIPAGRIAPQARALLAYYPAPNADTTGRANYQSNVAAASTRSGVQFGLNSQAGRRTTIGGAFAFQRSRTNSTGLLGFEDRNADSTTTAAANWQRRIHTRASAQLRYQFSRTSTTVTPYFANRTNVSADAGIAGNSQTPADWGPPSLLFPDLVGLTDVVYRQTTVLTHTAGGDVLFRRGRHETTVGGDAKFVSAGVNQQADPRGTLAFTGEATGAAFADFLLGIPSTSMIGFGSPRTPLHGDSYDAYVNDDWRLSGLTVTLGARWEYDAPFSDPSGVLGRAVRTDKTGVEPRLGASWRPWITSSFVIRASYGVQRNLGLYQPLAVLLLEQPPFSRTFSVRNAPQTRLSLASPFPESVASAATFAIDRAFRPAIAQNWTVSAQRDLPGSLTVVGAYLGTKGTRLPQASLPNSYPPGADNRCPSCPSGFVFVASGGDSLRHAMQLTVRRRLHDGFTAGVQYTLSKSTDDASTFGNTTLAPAALSIAQDWRNLEAERGPSAFDQRHLVAGQAQYATGVGVAGGTLVDSPWGRIYKEWTVTSQLTAGSGLPFTPLLFVPIAGTGFVGIRPDLTGVPPRPAAPGAYANPAAFAAPASGAWGNAGRNSLRGPAQFGLDASIARVFRLRGKTSFEWRIAAANVLNHVTFAAVNPSVTSPQFGVPTQANAMRRIQTTLRYRF